MKTLRALAALLLLAPAPLLAQASANARWVDNEGCWCGYQTGIVRDYWVRGRGASAAEKQATADMLSEWNRYVNLFNVRVDTSSGLGSRNGVNEVNTYITSNEAYQTYGFKMEPGLFGRAVMFPDESFGDFNECREFVATGCGPFTETDVVINAGFGSGWTPDWFNPGNDQRGGLAMVQATVLHEVGHTLGLHHIFKLPSGNSFSVMNYANDDAARWVTRIDSKTVRTQYPSRSGSLLDVAIYPLVYGNDQYAQEYATLSKTSVTPGEAFTADRWTLQNVGNQAASDVVVTFYAWPASTGRQYPQPGDVVLVNGSVGPVPVDAEGALSAPLTVPNGTAAGEYFVGAIVTVNGAEDQAWVAGKPSNNRFILGHGPRTVLRVLAGSGGGASLAADFSFSPVSPLAGQPVGFTDASRGAPAAWSWSFGDPSSGGSNASTSRNPSHTYASPGTYTVTLTVTGGGASNQTQRTISVGGKPTTGGTAVQTLFVPIVLDVAGQGGARFSSELTLANRGTSTSTVRLTYTPAPATITGAAGGGTVSETLQPGRQLVVADTIAYLRSKGLPIPGGGSNQGGTLRVRFEGLSSEDAGYAGVRTTTPSGIGRAGLSYPGLTPSQLLNGDSVIVGLRQNAADRSNLALANAGTSGTIRLKIYIVKGDGSAAVYLDPETELAPGQWLQYGRILETAGYSDGWILIERTAGTEPYTAYAVFNDNLTNDGSYVPAVPADSVEAFGTVPVLVETPTFRSELVLSNLSNERGYAFLEYFESLAAGGDSTGLFFVELGPLEQAVLPDVIDTLRAAGATIGPRGSGYAGALQVSYASDTSLLAGLSGARTGAPAPIGGQYGLFYTSLSGLASAVDAWVFGLQQSSAARSNLAIVNAGLFNEPIRVRLEVYNGATGQKVSEELLDPIQPGQWVQKNAVLGGVANGYVHLTVVDGFDAFYAYGVVNDGATSSSGTNDGSYVPMTVTQ